MKHYIVRFMNSCVLAIDAETELEAALASMQYLVVEEDKSYEVQRL
jgi:hypothetical protein